MKTMGTRSGHSVAGDYHFTAGGQSLDAFRQRLPSPLRPTENIPNFSAVCKSKAMRFYLISMTDNQTPIIFGEMNSSV